VKVIPGLWTVALLYAENRQVFVTLAQDGGVVKQMTLDTSFGYTRWQDLEAEVVSASCTYPMSTTPPTTGTLFSVPLNRESYSDISTPPLGEYEIRCSLLTVSFGTINMGSYTLNGAQLGG
jgi:hypothetical protein